MSEPPDEMECPHCRYRFATGPARQKPRSAIELLVEVIVDEQGWVGELTTKLAAVQASLKQKNDLLAELSSIVQGEPTP